MRIYLHSHPGITFVLKLYIHEYANQSQSVIGRVCSGEVIVNIEECEVGMRILLLQEMIFECCSGVWCVCLSTDGLACMTNGPVTL